MSLASLVEKISPNKDTVPITRMFYNDGKKYMSAKSGYGGGLSVGKLSGDMPPTIDEQMGWGIHARQEESQTTLYGDTKNAIIHEPLDCFQNDGGQAGGIDYHHHSNFNTKGGGHGGYMNLNLGGKPVEKTTMNGQQIDLRTLTLQNQGILKESSNWLTQSGTPQQEKLAQNFLDSFNKSDSFSPTNIKKSNLLSMLGK